VIGQKGVTYVLAGSGGGGSFLASVQYFFLLGKEPDLSGIRVFKKEGGRDRVSFLGFMACFEGEF
jgi:hypothetical protein